MKWKNNRYFRLGLTLFAVIAAAMLLYYAIFHMDSLKTAAGALIHVAIPLIYGAVMAYLFHPVVDFFERQIFGRLLRALHRECPPGMKKAIRLVSVFLTLFAVLLCIYGLMAMLIPEVINSITSIADNFPRYIDNIQKWTANVLKDNPELAGSVNELFNKYSVKLETWMTNDMLPQLNSVLREFSVGVVGVVVFLKNILLGLIISVYILYSKESLIGTAKKGLYGIFSVRTANQIIRDTQYIDNAFGGFLLGRILDSAIIGVLCYLGTTLLGMPYALLISVIVGVTNVIPFFGPYLGAIPSTLLIFIVSPLQAVYFVIFILILQQFDGNLLGPMILRGVTGLTSFLVIVSIIIGGGLFGIIGMLAAVPVCVVLCTVLRNFLNERLRRRGLSRENEYYIGIDHLDEETYAQVRGGHKEIPPEEVFRYGRKRRRKKEPDRAAPEAQAACGQTGEGPGPADEKAESGRPAAREKEKGEQEK